MKTERVKTNITVMPLDLTPLAPLDKVREVLQDNAITEVRFERSGIVLAEGGEPFALLDNEGTGYKLEHEDTLQFDFWVERPGRVSMFPSGTVEVPRADLPKYMTEPQNLAHFIRTFGSRIEANYALWVRELTGVAG